LLCLSQGFTATFLDPSKRESEQAASYMHK
jgi:hypothetical protein